MDLMPPLLLEILATAANLLFILLLIREDIRCWFFGITGSLLSVLLFIHVRLYFEAVLYVFYALMGCWGWLRWHRRLAVDDNPVMTWRPATHVKTITAGAACALGLGLLAQAYTDAERPLFDAATTCFSFIATYMEINKVLEGWIYWFVLNLASIWLYHDRSLDIYAALIALYTLLSVWGFFTWRRAWRAQSAAALRD
ncbi:MAG: nicotinamide riboside transporter PnuC [Halioglobus sp.]|nr:nicotinamide riboside transporter PnuC [Halioglobus sp.]